MNDKDIKLLEESFKKFYFEHFNLIHVPENPNQREYGFQKFNSGMSRHISLKTDKELHLLLMQKVPSDVYCSNACYSFPNLPSLPQTKNTTNEGVDLLVLLYSIINNRKSKCYMEISKIQPLLNPHITVMQV